MMTVKIKCTQEMYLVMNTSKFFYLYMHLQIVMQFKKILDEKYQESNVLGGRNFLQ